MPIGGKHTYAIIVQAGLPNQRQKRLYITSADRWQIAVKGITSLYSDIYKPRILAWCRYE